MKKRNTISLVLFIMLSAGYFSEAFSMGMGVGGTVWYTFWKPSFENWILDKDNPVLKTIKSSYKVNPQFFGGPSIMLTFNEKVGWTNSFFMSRYITRASTGQVVLPYLMGGFSLAESVLSIRNRLPIWKYDVDSVVNIRINDYFAVFVGLKFQSYNYTRQSQVIMPGSYTMFRNEKATTYTPGTGLGISFAVHLVENLYLQMSLSALYQLALIDYSARIYYIFGGGTILPYGSSNLFYNNGVGGNTNISLAYHIAAMKTTMALGFRYQGIYYLSSGAEEGKRINDNQFDHFYGATFSFMVLFDFKPGEEAG